MSAITTTAYVHTTSPTPHFVKSTVELPPLGPNDALIEVLACSICHTDMYSFGIEGIVPGHEVVGRVLDLGPQAKVDSEQTTEADGVVGITVKIGDVVGFGYLRSACLKCELCLKGSEIFCPKRKIFPEGKLFGFAEKTVWDARFLYPVPQGLEPKYAAPLLCAGATMFNCLFENNVSPTARVGVIGIGGLGHLGLQFARAWGCHVVAFSSRDNKKDEALKMGAHEFCTPQTTGSLGKLDFIINTVSASLDYDYYFSLLKPTGIFCTVGAQDDKKELEIRDHTVFILRNIRFMGSLVASRGAMCKMLQFANRHGIKPVIEEDEMSAQALDTSFDRLTKGLVRYRTVLVNKKAAEGAVTAQL
ncbi:uncharacterized protein SPPG_02863 [Spizellomyces punctatus DAOM BR117]|uniref:Enoyl reductase (ER) domain-containing protein n=1 Tax=Spizellomyces punctatus (strain DAOM BR117) TaxID=645134 RepID=A0A0L0HLT7_SPIPD|nr:uncharacterized protein SPPG_02863 [Spizellomyces punctatus DAOM BR117]KND02396.1 hypothetical protein SPPG_02863 [Spizellomyces punctatus DAOM BR117]|eukprot:XP_016610435.1 hypothetical protein SPPG_02863 [Spizellomyces punctatus DAOM BR117]